MKKQIFIFITFGLLTLKFSFNLSAQQPTFAKIYNTPYPGQANAIVKTFDNKYILAGVESNEALVFKIDSTGHIIWKKKIGSSNNESFNSLISTRDSCYVIVGNIISTVDSSSDILCVKINTNGDTLWTKEIDMGHNDYALSVQQTNDNGYILSGYSSQNSTPLSVIVVVKLDAGGNLIWGKTYAGSNYDNFANSIKQMPDSGYIVTGFTDSLSTDFPSTYLMRLTATGDISWTKKQVITSSNYTIGYDVIVSDSSLICFLAKNNINNNSIIMKTDFGGNVLWCKKYNVSGYYYYGNGLPPLKIHSISDSVFIFNSGQSFTKIDSSGNLLWSKSGQLALLVDVQENSDKGFISFGFPYILVKPYGNGLITIIKSDSLGNSSGSNCNFWNSMPTYSAFPINLSAVNFTSASTASIIASHPVISCSSLTIYGDGCVVGNIEESNSDKSTFQVYPDPATDKITIGTLQKGFLEILNIQGQIIFQQSLQEEKTDINVREFAKGIYILKLSNNNKTEVTRFVKK